MTARLWAGRTWRVLALAAVLLALLSPTLRFGAAALRRAGADVSGTIPTLFDVNSEANVPSVFSVLLWVLLGGVAVLVAVLDRRHRLGLAGLAAVAALLGVDEAVSLHEQLDGLGSRISGAPHFSWVLPGAVIAAVLVAALARTVLSLARPASALLLLGGAVFVLGAVVLETVSGVVLDAAGDGVVYALVTMLEELAEMEGVLLAVAGLLSLLEGPLLAPRFSVEAPSASGRRPASALSGSAARVPSP